MVDFLRKLDGSGRKPRDVQIEALTWLADNWNKADVFFLKCPVALGKSLLARSIQLETGAAIITPSNVLINQYCETYPLTNALKGKSHYTCSVSGFDCKTWTDVCEQKACDNCIYQKSKSKAAVGVPTFFNPMSMYYLKLSEQKAKRLDVIVVDEAHTLSSMVSMLCSKSFRQADYHFTDAVANETHLERWLVEQLARLKRLFDQYVKTNRERARKIDDEITGLKAVLTGIQDNPQNYSITITEKKSRGRKERYLNVTALDPPDSIMSRVLQAKKFVFMSGTLFKHDIDLLARGRPFKVLDLPSPIPKDSRPILFHKSDVPMNRDTNPADIVRQIETIITANPGLNTIIHTTYSMIEKLAPHFTVPIIYNNQVDKEAKIAQFIKEGGVFLAAGCAEGLDLKGDLCRLNIIPKMSFPNLGDPVVVKKKSRTGGDQWYSMETMKVLIQQVGRSTRAVDDWSKTYILDPMFPVIFNRLKSSGELPISFVESIVWEKV